MSKPADKQILNRELLACLVDMQDGWTWIGRTALRNGIHGTFSVTLLNGQIGTYRGITATFAPFGGGAIQSIDLAFADIVDGHPSLHINGHAGGTLDFHGFSITGPLVIAKALETLHTALRDWALIMDRVHETMEADEQADSARRSRRKRG